MEDFDVSDYNISAHAKNVWKNNVKRENCYTIPVDRETVELARNGHWNIYLTKNKPVPHNWFPSSLAGLRILAVASGGGQQGPILSALGADVTVLDNSPEQLEKDRLVAQEEGLSINLLEGDMCKLDSYFDSESFDIILNPVSSMYIKDIYSFYKGVSHICKSGGTFMTGFINPAYFLFDHYKMEHDILEVKYKIPYNPFEQLGRLELGFIKSMGCELAFGHSLTELISYPLSLGFSLHGFFEDTNGVSLDKYMEASIAILAKKNIF